VTQRMVRVEWLRYTNLPNGAESFWKIFPVRHKQADRPTQKEKAGMGKKLYVGNLSYATKSADLEQLFAQHGSVQSAEVITDRDSGRSKGFGFVEMGTDEEAQAAITALNEKEVGGRQITVNEARPRAERTGGGGGGPRRSGGGGFGGGGGRGGGGGSRGGGDRGSRW
jgi:RNA recognition motif-containing protein